MRSRLIERTYAGEVNRIFRDKFNLRDDAGHADASENEATIDAAFCVAGAA